MNGKPPDPVDAAIAAGSSKPVTWQQANGRLALPSGRYIEVGIPADINAAELVSAIDALVHFAEQVQRQRAPRILVPS